jgi:hypothetical protein
VEVDQEIVRREMDYFSQFVVITFFFGRKHSEIQMLS